MNSDPLLDAIFAPGEESLVRALTVARRQRVRGQIALAVAATTCLMAIGFFLVPPSPPSITVAVQPPLIEIVSSRPLAVREILRTDPTSVMIISTPTAPSHPSAISDIELLVLLNPARVALVGDGAGCRLVEF